MTALHSSSTEHYHLAPSAPWQYGSGTLDEHAWPPSADFTSIPSAHAHPDLPSEPPGYDEFEFSFPTDLSPSLFSGLPLHFPDSPQSQQQLEYSYTFHDDRPSPKADVHVESPYTSQHGLLPPLPPPPPLAGPVAHDLRTVPIPSTSHEGQSSGQPKRVPLVDERQSQALELPGRSSSLTRSKRLFEEDERSALDAFFDTLDAAPHVSSSAGGKRSCGIQTSGRPAKKAKQVVVEADTALQEGRHTEMLLDPSASSTSALVQKDEGLPDDTNGQAELKAGTNRRGRPPAGKSQPKARVAPKARGKTATAASALSDRSQSADSPASLPGQAEATSAGAHADAGESLAATASSTNSKRSNHIASEQRRRTTIKENYKSLVDLLLAGELRSGISLSSAPGSTMPGEDDDGLDDGAESSIIGNGNGKKGSGTGSNAGAGRGKGRGRGRKGQDGAGATKSVVLERAADYLRWLERGNTALLREIESLEQAGVH